MSIGSKFLARINEAKAVKGVEATSAKFDAATERLKKSLRQVGAADLADRIAETLNLLGVPGRFLNTEEVRDSITESALSLKSKPARVTALLGLHSALSSASIAEAKVEDLSGNSFQKMVEEVIAELGFSTTEPVVLAKIKRAAAKFQQDQSVKTAIITFARKFQIKVSDDVVGSKKIGESEEPTGWWTAYKEGNIWHASEGVFKTKAEAQESLDDSGNDEDLKVIYAKLSTKHKIQGIRLLQKLLPPVKEADEPEDMKQEPSFMKQAGMVKAKAVLAALGLDINDLKPIAGQPRETLAAIRAAVRDPKVLRGLSAFENATK